ncbi:GGDEF domain-containing protein [Neobacillus drentensis]|uniref:GGDEF domain-containing protein n=1 Tax=Neobacillus drentensis TaxID=220684 RepID=UPI002FFED43F
MKLVTRTIVTFVTISGAIVTLISIYNLLKPEASTYYIDLFILSLCFFILSPWSVRMASGASWRPAVMLVIISAFLVPPALSFLVALPGLIRITYKSKDNWRKYLLTFGHIGLGLAAGGSVFYSLNLGGTIEFSTPLKIIPLLLGIFVHFVVNRLISFFIVADQTGINLKKQFITMFREIHWGYLNLYLTSLFTIIAFKELGYLALLLSLFLLMGIFKSTIYYTKLQQLQNTAYMDALTQVENRASYEAFKQQMEVNPYTGTVSMIDLDNFKVLNDTYGHPEGDKILKETASFFSRSLRNGDRIFRYGGDEFIIFMPHDNEKGFECKRRMERLTSDLNEHFKLLQVSVSASVGCALYSGDDSFKAALLEADKQMYQAKAQRKMLDDKVKQKVLI